MLKKTANLKKLPRKKNRNSRKNRKLKRKKNRGRSSSGTTSYWITKSAKPQTSSKLILIAIKSGGHDSSYHRVFERSAQ